MTYDVNKINFEEHSFFNGAVNFYTEQIKTNSRIKQFLQGGYFGQKESLSFLIEGQTRPLFSEFCAGDLGDHKHIINDVYNDILIESEGLIYLHRTVKENQVSLSIEFIQYDDNLNKQRTLPISFADTEEIKQKFKLLYWPQSNSRLHFFSFINKGH